MLVQNISSWLVGIAGAIAGAAVEVGTRIVTGTLDEMTLGDLAGAAVSGAVVGAVIGATGGLSLVAGAITGGAAGFAGNVAKQVVVNEGFGNFDLGEAIISGAAGVIGGAIGGGDTAFDVFVGGQDFTSSLITNTIGSILGDAIGRSIGFGVKRAWNSGVGQTARAYVGGLGDALSAGHKAGSTWNWQPFRQFWTKDTIFQGSRVFQRNDLFDPKLMTSWKVKGKTVHGTNLQRMATGRAPVGYDGQSVNLHHLIQTQSSSIAEVAGSMHQKYYRILHINTGELPSGINRSAFDKWRAAYWMNRAQDFQ